MMDHLKDTTTYKKVSKNMTQYLQNKCNTMVTEWEKLRLIDGKVAKHLKTYNGIIPKIYGLPKVHKPSCPYRVKVSYCVSPLYHISTYYCDILTNIIGKTDRTVKNSYKKKKK